MKFTAEHEALRRTARQFVENELNPNIRNGKKLDVSRSTMYLKRWVILAYWGFVSLRKMVVWL